MLLRNITTLLLAVSVCQPALANNQVVTYDVPQKALYSHHNDDFTVRVRIPGGEWQDLYEYNVKVDHDKPRDASMVHFDMDGEVEVSVKKNNGDVSRVEIRPASAKVKPTLKGNTARFTLKNPANLSIEFDGDRLHNLHLFANPLQTDIPNEADPDVIWFGPGVHTPPQDTEGAFVIPSNKTVYIHGSALLQGKLLINNAHNVNVVGRGIIDQGGRGFEVTKSEHITLDGPVVINPKHYTVYCGQTRNLTIRNIKAFSAASWTDGIDMMSCSDVEIDKVFLRTSDDSIAIYGHRWDYYGDSRNITVTNSTLWADVAHPINIGLHGNKENPEMVENIIFRNIDILGHDEDDRNYQGAMAISNSDNNLVRNVLFEDIRVDSIEEGMLFNIRVVYNEKYSHAPGRGVENITFRNITSRADDINRSVIGGFSAERMVKNITFENVTVMGKPLHREDIDVGDYVENITIKR
ncbi:glycosyl hydrolase family 28 protein [Cellvibrio polysaccharolyticus]|uniref:Glycoside hydrolase n=1 Tax=Cellvibrio polysaccharolyticus TaxID=2082724 RepID=A0A928V4G7_9GAMM|nr:glycosyl hydrolase family 28 protein [Cellvibrio polysaccharolyticus]MBE8718570.1 glycoside hydrolase [Cellvibrio polysaccharolyticus]